MPAFLVPVDPGLCVVPLEKAIVLIGRQSDCDVSLTQSRKVSRRHCCLAQVNNQIIARDLGSTNGIYLNGERVKKQCRLKLGDELMIGDLKFRLQSDPNPQRGKKAVTFEEPPENPLPNDDKGPISSKPTPFVRSLPDGGIPNLEIPVVLPDDGRDFAVEPSIAKMPVPVPRRKPAEGDVIPLGSDSSI